MTPRTVRHRRWYFWRRGDRWHMQLIIGAPLHRTLHPGPWRPAPRWTEGL
jgi:hypothetical protein